jgi:hypothetical protein
VRDYIMKIIHCRILDLLHKCAIIGT